MSSIMQCDGYMFTVVAERDDDTDPPWENSDGHGPVEYRSFRGSVHCPTAPGERVLHIDNGDAWVYDVQKAQQIALRDGWGISDETRRAQLLLGHHLTRRRVAAVAVQQDMDYLRGYLRGDWYYVFITVTLMMADGCPSERFASLGGLEYGLAHSDECIHEYAQELAREILTQSDT